MSIEFERHLSCTKAICISSQGASQALRPEVEEVQVLQGETFWRKDQNSNVWLCSEDVGLWNYHKIGPEL